MFCPPKHGNFLHLLGYYEETTMEDPTACLGVSYKVTILGRTKHVDCSVIFYPKFNFKTDLDL